MNQPPIIDFATRSHFADKQLAVCKTIQHFEIAHLNVIPVRVYKDQFIVNVPWSVLEPNGAVFVGLRVLNPQDKREVSPRP